MSRPLRIEFDGALYHVTSRGNAQEAIFADDRDRTAFLELLGTVCTRFDWSCLAWCLMGNHYHLLVETHQPTLSQGMRHLNGVYTQRFNRRHDRVGHVLQGRFHAVLVDGDHYLLAAARYIVLNPVRAGLAGTAAHWRWSSFIDTCTPATAPEWLDVRRVLSLLGPDATRATNRYIEYVHQADSQTALWESLRNQIYLGDADFVRHALDRRAPPARRTGVPAVQQRPVAGPLESSVPANAPVEDRIVAAYRSGSYTQRDLAAHFRMSQSRVSKIVAARRGGSGEG